MAHDRPDDEDDRSDDEQFEPDDERRSDTTDDERPSDAADDERPSERDADGRRRPESDPRASDGPFGLRIGGRIGKLLEFLDDADERSNQPRRRPSAGRERGGLGRTPGGNRDSSDPFSVDLDVSIGSLGGDERTGGPSGRSRERRRRERVADDTGEYLTTARHDGDEVVVTADLPGVERSDLAVGVTDDGETLVVGADGEELARVPVGDWDESDVRATFNNFVLEVRIDDDAVAGDPAEVVGR